jgi:hypothetical protein
VKLFLVRNHGFTGLPVKHAPANNKGRFFVAVAQLEKE